MLNNSILMGRFTADPELSQTPNNISVCRFSITVERPYVKDKEKEVDFFQIVAWRGTAEFIVRNFTKGKMIIVQGSLRTNTYTDKNNIKRYGVEILANQVFFADSKKTDETVATPSDLSEYEEVLNDGETPFQN